MGNNKVYEAAKEYRRKGLAPIPLKYESKVPLIDWKPLQYRLPTEDELDEWFNNGQPSNIGIVCGSISENLVVLDFDNLGQQWEDLLDRVEQRYGKRIYDLTPVVGTDKGFHVYLQTKAPASSHKLDGIDIKGEGGYVVAPPSVHPSGVVYQFVNPEVIEILEIDSLEDVGIETPSCVVVQPKEPNWVTEALLGVSEGERDITCTRLAGYFKNHLREDITFAVLKHWGECCIPPFPEKDVEKCVRSVYRYRQEFPSIPSPLGYDVMEVIEEPKGLTLQWAKDIRLPENGDLDTLWGTFLFPGSIHLLSGEAGVGKTTFLYNLAVKASKEEEFIGIPFPKPLKVLYLDLETPDGLRARKLHLIAEGQPPDGLAFNSSASIDHSLKELITLVKEHAFDLVVVDTINEAFLTEKEDDNAEANRQMMLVRQLVQQGGCAVLLAHHIGKGEQGKKVYKARGASARVASVDVVINLEGMSDDVVRLEMVKNRWVGGNARLFLRKAGEDIFETTEVADEDASSDRFRAQDWMLQEFQGREMQRKEILERCKEQGFSQSTGERALSDLTQLGKVRRPRRGFYIFPSLQS